MKQTAKLTHKLLRGYETHLKFFNIEEEEEIYNLLALRDELLKMELTGKDRERLNKLEAEFKKLLPELEQRYPSMVRAFVKGEPVEPQGVFWKVR